MSQHRRAVLCGQYLCVWKYEINAASYQYSIRTYPIAYHTHRKLFWETWINASYDSTKSCSYNKSIQNKAQPVAHFKGHTVCIYHSWKFDHENPVVLCLDPFGADFVYFHRLLARYRHIYSINATFPWCSCQAWRKLKSISWEVMVLWFLWWQVWCTWNLHEERWKWYMHMTQVKELSILVIHQIIDIYIYMKIFIMRNNIYCLE